MDNWRSRISGRLNRFKRYPKDALRLKRQGVGQVRFTLDRQGHVLAVTLVSSAGLPSLDREIQALVKRASPLPTPPADAYVNGTVELTLPIDFSLRGAGFEPRQYLSLIKSFFSSLSCHSLFSKRIVILFGAAELAFCAIFSFKKHECLLFCG